MAVSETVRHAKQPAGALGIIETRMQAAIEVIGESDCPVLIVGEHGCGKRLVAARIHERSRRARYPLAEIQGETAEPGLVETALAAKGTLYLAEIGELTLDVQDVIIDRYFHSSEVPKSRLICGTSRELVGDVKSGKMREDFYYLTSAVTLRMSPLRCRKSEILSIADELMTEYSRQFDRPKPLLQGEIVQFLLEHTWPENLSELQTAIKTYVAIGDQSVSVAALKAAAASMKSSGARKSFSLKEASRAASTEVERQLIAEVLVSTGGNRKRAADELGISYKALLYKLKQVEAAYPSAANKNGVAL